MHDLLDLAAAHRRHSQQKTGIPPSYILYTNQPAFIKVSSATEKRWGSYSQITSTIRAHLESQLMQPCSQYVIASETLRDATDSYLYSLQM